MMAWDYKMILLKGRTSHFQDGLFTLAILQGHGGYYTEPDTEYVYSLFTVFTDKLRDVYITSEEISV
jgi:hypothetical protein